MATLTLRHEERALYNSLTCMQVCDVKIMKFPGKKWHNFLNNFIHERLTSKPKSQFVFAVTFATAAACVSWDVTRSLHCLYANRVSRLHVSDFRWPSASSRRVCSALSHMQMREWYYTKGEFSKCHSARKLWEILCFERVLHSSPRPPRADWRDAIANPIKTHDSVFTACRSFLAWGLIVFAALLLLITAETSVGFSEPKSDQSCCFTLWIWTSSINQFVCFLFCGRPLAALAAFGGVHFIFN